VGKAKKVRKVRRRFVDPEMLQRTVNGAGDEVASYGRARMHALLEDLPKRPTREEALQQARWTLDQLADCALLGGMARSDHRSTVLQLAAAALLWLALDEHDRGSKQIAWEVRHTNHMGEFRARSPGAPRGLFADVESIRIVAGKKILKPRARSTVLTGKDAEKLLKSLEQTASPAEMKKRRAAAKAFNDLLMTPKPRSR
jgi:hypothetical protein